MRRDYFTCVFLGLIAGALVFVCFKPLYFTYEQIIPRDFSLFERVSSVAYALFFIVFLPFFAAFKKKEWINWGLAAYGIMAYLPLWFYPASELITGDDPKLLHVFGALVLRTIYAVMQAPFAALSQLIGNDQAAKVVYWILPVAIAWPIIFRIIRFYRRAYLSEQLNPMPQDKAAPKASQPSEAFNYGKPEVLGTVISAPVTAQTPVDVTRNVTSSEKSDDVISMPPSKEQDEPIPMKESQPAKRAGVRAPVRPVHISVGAPETEKVEALSAGEKKEDKAPDVIEMPAPKPKADEAIPMPPPKPKADEAIPMPAPKAKEDEAIPMGAPKPKTDEAIPMPPPANDGVIPLGSPASGNQDK